MLGGALAGGIGDAATQAVMKDGDIDWGEVGVSAGIGAVFGAFAKPGAKGGGKTGRGHAESAEAPAPASRGSAQAQEPVSARAASEPEASGGGGRPMETGGSGDDAPLSGSNSDSGPAGGGVHRSDLPLRTDGEPVLYGHGDYNPKNGTVTVPKGTKLEPLRPGDSYVEGTTRVDRPTLLSDLLKPGMGTCHWAACLGRQDPTRRR
jgi:hypothetical protein